MTLADAPVVQPVLLGGDFGVYALARSFHEAYGVTSIVRPMRNFWQRLENSPIPMRTVLWSLLLIMTFILNLLHVIGIL